VQIFSANRKRHYDLQHKDKFIQKSATVYILPALNNDKHNE